MANWYLALHFLFAVCVCTQDSLYRIFNSKESYMDIYRNLPIRCIKKRITAIFFMDSAQPIGAP